MRNRVLAQNGRVRFIHADGIWPAPVLSSPALMARPQLSKIYFSLLINDFQNRFHSGDSALSVMLVRRKDFL